MAATHRLRLLRPRAARARAVVATLTVAAALATTIASPALGATGAAKPVGPATWAERVCTEVAQWDARLAAAAPRVVATDPTAARTALTGTLAEAVVATDTLVRALRAAGVPDTARGRAMRRALIRAYSDVGQGLVGALGTARTLPTTDPAAFAAAATTLQTGIQATLADADAAFAAAARSHPSAALDRAFRRAPACRAATAGPAPATG